MASPNGTVAPPAPNFAQLPLPPGMTLDQYEETQGKLVSIAISAAVALAVVSWDYIILLRDEIQLYTSSSRSLWLSPATWGFVILRYSAFIATIPSLWFTSLETENCSVTATASQTGAVLVVAASGVIFTYRVAAIWNGSLLIYGITGIAYVLMVACWIAVATSFHLTTGPHAAFIPSNCQPDPIPNWAPISYASSVLFDIVVLVLTLWKLRSNRLPGSAVSRQIYWDSVVYFVATASANITVLVVQSLGHEYDLLKPAIIPLSTVMTVTMAQRVFLNLKLLHQRRERQARGLSVSGSSLPGNNTLYSSRPFPRSDAEPSEPSERSIGARALSSEGYNFKPDGLSPFSGHELLHIKPDSITSPTTERSSLPYPHA